MRAPEQPERISSIRCQASPGLRLRLRRTSSARMRWADIGNWCEDGRRAAQPPLTEVGMGIYAAFWQRSRSRYPG